MNETMGKRIAVHRKRLGMTQDQMAEKLGITAQAVSKWENDLSCPDIAMLPRLAELFGITTDELLGVAGPRVYEATVDSQEEREPEGIHVSKGDFEFKWEGGRKHSLMLALWVLLAGGLLLASGILGWGAGFWELLWPSGLLVFGLAGLFPGRKGISFLRLGIALVGGYFLANNLEALPQWLDKALLLPGFLLLLGLSLLADALRRPRKDTFHIHTGIPEGKSASDFEQGEDSFRCTTRFGSQQPQIVLDRLRSGSAEVAFGELVLDLRDCAEFTQDCSLRVSCAFGEMTILLPRNCLVEHRVSQSFGNLSVQGEPDKAAACRLKLNGSVSFGQIQIRYQ